MENLPLVHVASDGQKAIEFIAYADSAPNSSATVTGARKVSVKRASVGPHFGRHPNIGYSFADERWHHYAADFLSAVVE